MELMGHGSAESLKVYRHILKSRREQREEAKRQAVEALARRQQISRVVIQLPLRAETRKA